VEREKDMNFIVRGLGELKYADYTKLDKHLEEYKEVILREHAELEQSIIYCFE